MIHNTFVTLVYEPAQHEIGGFKTPVDQIMLNFTHQCPLHFKNKHQLLLLVLSGNSLSVLKNNAMFRFLFTRLYGLYALL